MAPARRIVLAALGLLLLVLPATASDGQCLIVADARTGAIVHEAGAACDDGIGPASTFKLTLAVMGFDAGILEGPDAPAWPYRNSYDALRAVDRETTTPASWMRESVLWYSRVLVERLGAERFAAYVRAFDYGNADVSGDPGADNGLTHSWLNRSLLITPREHLGFVHRLLTGRLPVSSDVARQALALLPVFEAGEGWRLHGKTGTGYIRESDGRLGRRQYGWFVGWADGAGDPLVFSYLVRDSRTGQTAAGPRARDDLVARWGSVVGP